MKNLFQHIGMEDASEPSVKNKETEIVIYAKVTEPARLEEATSKEEQVQLESQFLNGTRCRVRKTTVDGKDSYQFTFKVKTLIENSPMEANDEYTTEVDAEFFKGFELVCDQKLVKTRYNFSSDKVTLTYKQGEEEKSIVIPNVNYEVDVFKTEQGEISEMCKIDVEVDSIMEYLERNHPELKETSLNVKVTHLPFAPTDPILGSGANDTQRIKIDKFWESVRHTKQSV